MINTMGPIDTPSPPFPPINIPLSMNQTPPQPPTNSPLNSSSINIPLPFNTSDITYSTLNSSTPPTTGSNQSVSTIPINSIPLPPVNNTPEIFLNNNMEKYKDEIIILRNMGFTDENKILEAIIVSDGNINNAIHYYLR